ncbi:MAG TPA: MnhB domain-containing protein [Acidimicrobiia bacterium]|nr:MnhB domain-containing protein [Acidimicrobiia bacterium]
MIHRSFILDTLVDVIVRTALVFSLFLLFSGHNSPGGGFVAGLVFGIALILKYVAGGIERMQEILPMSAETMLASGLSLSILTGIAGWLWGEAFLESTYIEVDLPLLGALKASSTLPFDIGVFAIVIGLVAALVVAFGTGEDVK